MLTMADGIGRVFGGRSLSERRVVRSVLFGRPGAIGVIVVVIVALIVAGSSTGVGVAVGGVGVSVDVGHGGAGGRSRKGWLTSASNPWGRNGIKKKKKGEEQTEN